MDFHADDVQTRHPDGRSRVAEELIFAQGQGLPGSFSNDIQAATSLARNMVTRWGYSDAVGHMASPYGDNQEEVFLGYQVACTQNVSEDTVEKIDAEVCRPVLVTGWMRRGASSPSGSPICTRSPRRCSNSRASPATRSKCAERHTSEIRDDDIEASLSAGRFARRAAHPRFLDLEPAWKPGWPLVMGVVNVIPPTASLTGGRFLALDDAVARVLAWLIVPKAARHPRHRR